MSATTGRPTAESREEQQINQQLDDTRTRLVENYTARDGVSAQEVLATFDAVRARFADARIRGFLPILVERAVRAQLG